MNIVIHTPTLEDYEDVVKYALSIGVKWANGSTSIYTEQWHTYKKVTCVHIFNTILLFSSYSYFVDESYQILDIYYIEEIKSKRRCDDILKEFI